MVEDVTTAFMPGEAGATKEVTRDASCRKLAKRALHDLGATSASDEPASWTAPQGYNRTRLSAHGAQRLRCALKFGEQRWGADRRTRTTSAKVSLRYGRHWRPATGRFAARSVNRSAFRLLGGRHNRAHKSRQWDLSSSSLGSLRGTRVSPRTSVVTAILFLLFQYYFYRLDWCWRREAVRVSRIGLVGAALTEAVIR